MTGSWPEGVRARLLRQGYTRTPEDVVARREVAAGPPLRDLRWGSRHQTVRGTLPLRFDEGAAFETWWRDGLDFGAASFSYTLYDHPAPREVTARFLRPPVRTQTSAIRAGYALELQIVAPLPTPEALAGLAALDEAEPAMWPAGVQATPRRAGYQAERLDPVLRGPEDGPPAARLLSRHAGTTETVSVPMDRAELEAFEAWFETDAALGARDIAWPVAGGVHAGCFASGYTVAGAEGRADFSVSFERYLEAVT